jgi:Domain of unknown function (DUF4337)
MPDEPEIDTDSVRESIEKHHGAPLIKRIALTTALFAALGAVAALESGDTVNRALVLKTEAGRLQAEASDQWNYYQAKGIKGNVVETSRAIWLAAGKAPPPEVEASIKKYAADQKEIEKAAREKEHARDEASREADEQLERHHHFANSVAFIQVAIALGAVAALTQARLVWYGSLGMGAVGAGMFFLKLLM